jgi:hypothetical protein
MLEIQANILVLGSETLLPQFKNSETAKVNFSRMQYSYMEKIKKRML